jgi:magnesium chelatase family protein
MALATAHTVSLQGALGHLIDVQADVSAGSVGTTLVGRPDASLNEARDRCRMAVSNSGVPWPATRRVTILLAPSDLVKRGTHFDLAIALAVLAACGDISQRSLSDTLVIGELTLSGGLRSVPGVLPMVLAAAGRGFERVIVPEPQAREASMVPGMTVLGMRSLAQVRAELKGEIVPDAPPVAPMSGSRLIAWRGSGRLSDHDLADLDGVPDVKFALEVAAAGGHHLMLSGPKGSGKTSLAERLPGILPDLSAEEALELTAIHSLAGALEPGDELIVRPPFFAPHHDASKASLLGGGTGRVRPGEVSRSHCGVLFLDEFPLFRTDVIDSLRQPLENGEVTIARGEESATYPARGMVVMACNPCPCGEYTPLVGGNRCSCTEQQRRHYSRRVTGPVQDRIDILRHVLPPQRGGAPALREAGAIRRGARTRGRRPSAPGGQVRRTRLAAELPGPQRGAGPRVATARCRASQARGAARRGEAQPSGRGTRPPSRLDRGRPPRSALPDDDRSRHGAPAAARRATPRGGGRQARLVSHDDRLARVALGRLTEPGDPRVANLVAELGAVRLHAALSDERDPTGLLTEVASRIRTLDPHVDLARAAKAGIRFVVPGDDEWPNQLDDLMRADVLDERGGPPLGLWVRGPKPVHELCSGVAVVGSRSATTYGCEVASSIGTALVRAGYPVVSGAAFGIDHAAHRGALAVEGATAAVLACGVDRPYPAAHRELLEHLARTSAVIAEVPPGCAPTRGRFLSRNRLIAALTSGTVVVEAASRSGALNTANWAVRLNRHLMGVPGPVTSAQSQGVHELIRSGAATLVTQGAEVLEVVGAAGTHLVTAPRAPTRRRDSLTSRHQRILDAVPLAQPAGADSIATTAGLGLIEVRSALSRLQRLGLVEGLGSGWRLTPASQE